jgi:hypothetical protein
MTAAPVITEETADWAVAWRLMNRKGPGPRPATVAESRLAVWLLLDCGCEQSDIRERTGLTKGAVYEVVKLRRAAGRSGISLALGLAPSRYERTILGVPMGITRPGS